MDSSGKCSWASPYRANFIFSVLLWVDRLSTVKGTSATQTRRDTELVNLVSEGSDSDSGTRNPLRKCRSGHTFLARSLSSECPFCLSQLKKFREFAHRKGGRLLSEAISDSLLFHCHRRDHKDFPLTIQSIRGNPAVWCPQCHQNSRRQIASSSSQGADSHSRTSHKRRLEDLVEENKRDQARLLSSAKQLYKLATKSSTSSDIRVPFNISFKIREETSRDLKSNPNLSEEQCHLIRSILACEHQPVFSWALVATALNLPQSTEKDKLFRRAAKLIHPDKCKHPQSDSAFKILNALIHSNN